VSPPTWEGAGTVRVIVADEVAVRHPAFMTPALPPVRIVRQAGNLVAPPRVPLRTRLQPVIEGGRTVLGYMVAFAPLTAIALFTLAVLIAAYSHAGP
jgi:hypothetical protein